MKKRVFLGIDTSNYTTSLAKCDECGEIIENYKVLLPVKDGENGLRQSDAVFAHIKNFQIIAEKIRERLDYSLMVNHDSIEVSDKIFGRGTPAQKELNKIIRKGAFETAIKYNIDMIFTFVTAFDSPEDIEYLNNLRIMFEATGGQFYFVELEAITDTKTEDSFELNARTLSYSSVCI